jgi:hypothetical protein
MEQVFRIGCSVTVCNQIRSHEVVFGKRAVVGAVRVFKPTSGYVFNFGCLDSLRLQRQPAQRQVGPRFLRKQINHLCSNFGTGRQQRDLRNGFAG